MQIQDEYSYHSPGAHWLEPDIWPRLRSILNENCEVPQRVFELGCGNGATAAMLSEMGYEVIGVDPSRSGIDTANKAYPTLQLKVGSAYDDLRSEYGQFPIVISLEVVEHCYYPRKFAAVVADLLQDDGLAIISTPFHGYWKNLVLSILNKWDAHLNPLWDHGHIKFFSESTLRKLIQEVGLQISGIYRVGRVGALAKSMIMVAIKRKRDG